MVLRVHEGVADESDVAHYADEVFGGHGVPFVAVDVGVVDLVRIINEIFLGEGEEGSLL